MFQIKICGITNLADAQAAVDAGADAIGLNFFRGSKRLVDLVTAERICRELPEEVCKVGVFVNAAAAEIAEAVERAALGGVQLHGDEPPEALVEVPPGIVLVRAYRCGAAGLSPLGDYLTACEAIGRSPDAVLVDADAGPLFGGTGRVADWTVVARERPILGVVPLLLSGGLTPDNVAAAVAAVRPDGVDVASGVEWAPGQKDRQRMVRFVEVSRRALNGLE